MIQAQNKEITLIRKSMHISSNFIYPLVIILSLICPTTEAEQAEYLYHFCPDNTTFTINSEHRANRDILLSSLSSNGIRENGFYNTTAGKDPDMVYGLFLCRGDVSTSDCQSCITMAVNDISRLCPVETTAVIWYDTCHLRYSIRNIFSVVTDEPVVVSLINNRTVTVTGTEQDRLNQFILRIVNDTATLLRNEPAGAKRVARQHVNISRFQIVHTLAQCTPDLSVADCDRCLRVAIAKLPTGQPIGGRSLNPSCSVRYKFEQCYNQTAAPAPPAPEEKKQSKSNWITILASSLSATFVLAVVSFSGFFIWRRRNSTEDKENSQEFQLLDLVNEHSRHTLRGENMGNSEDLPSIQLDILHVATNHFSKENKLGEGGFGPVYKGTLVDGKEIAVKRLSATSSQGLVEFKNEVMLIARLQHKILVRLLGCCLEKNEKLLVYEFMPNGSLDALLFGLFLDVRLDWQKRLSIVKGIARGIMYLHEDSRLRIIHRDLKASNVLLDHKMNPKISDFGMARIFCEDKNEANTKRVVGTYGYMAPEYAMRGLFSIKSDVFSFGVLLLEIISGKKSNSFLHSDSGESLLIFAWNLWSKGEGMELIDPLLVPSCVASEVLQCIHIGLLCVQNDPTDRPTMSSVIFMLASDCTIMLPHPTEPTFFVGRVVVEPSEPISKDGVFSINEVTISNFSAR